MKEKYTRLVFELIEFSAEDVIVTSGEDDEEIEIVNPNKLPDTNLPDV